MKDAIAWKPIASAPRDGTLISVKRMSGGQAVAEGRAYWGKRDPSLSNVEADREDYAKAGRPAPNFDAWIREGGQFVFPEPTHWR